MKGRDFPASKSLLGLGPSSSTSSQRRSTRGLRASSSAMRLSMAASDSGTKGRKLSGPGGTSSCAILSSCSFRGQREAQLGQGAAVRKGKRVRVDTSLWKINESAETFPLTNDYKRGLLRALSETNHDILSMKRERRWQT